MQPQRRSIRSDSFAFSSLLSGAYASAAVALLFLVVDAVRGDILFTPSLIGSVLLLGDAPSANLPVRLDMVAYYSLVHFGLFALLGTAASAAYLRMTPVRWRAEILGAVLGVLLTAGAIAVDSFWVPGLVGAIGLLAVVAANLMAAAVMAAFVHGVLGDGADEVTDARIASERVAR